MIDVGIELLGCKDKEIQRLYILLCWRNINETLASYIIGRPVPFNRNINAHL